MLQSILMFFRSGPDAKVGFPLIRKLRGFVELRNLSDEPRPRYAGARERRVQHEIYSRDVYAGIDWEVLRVRVFPPASLVAALCMSVLASWAGLSAAAFFWPKVVGSPATSARPAPLVARGGREFRELRRFRASEATQGVAVDATHFYAVDARRIGKYEKASGRKVGGWEAPPGPPITHLNSGVVVEGRLFCAHSNYPSVPMTSSIEVWQLATLTHVESHSFGIFEGSGAWVDRRGGTWWVGFAHYAGRGGEPGKGPEDTAVVVFDEDWRRITRYVLPPVLIDRLDGYSLSGATWGADGLLYATPHHKGEIYVLRLPESTSTLELVEVLSIGSRGQGVAWDRSQPGVLYSIDRESREVIVWQLATRS